SSGVGRRHGDAACGGPPRHGRPARHRRKAGGMSHGYSLQKASFAESVLPTAPGQQGAAAMPAGPPDRRNVKSAAADASNGTADRHERAKDYLSPAEVTRLLDAAKAGRRGVRAHLLLLMGSRPGLRVSEAVGGRRAELDLDGARLWVRR